jgi:hypothetical protein
MDKLDATAAAVAVVNGPEDVALGWDAVVGARLRATYGVCGSGSSRRRRRGTSNGSATAEVDAAVRANTLVSVRRVTESTLDA